jgi:aminoglycoside phosphotransferase (APT) family kinase protein
MTKPDTDVTALLLRAIANELATRIVPELTSADAIERATFAKLLSQNLAADIDVLPEVAARLMPPLRLAIKSALGGGAPGDVALRAFALQLQEIARDCHPGTQLEIRLSRELAANLVRHLADHDSTGSHAAAIAQLGGCDARWLQDYDAACKARLEQSAATGAGSAPISADPTAEMITAYLRQRFPADTEIRATNLVSIPGGRSKKTFFFDVTGTSALPPQVVMRQDYALKYAGTRIVDEHRPLAALAGVGLPVPRPLYLEASATALGPPFLLVDRLRGKPPGSYFSIAQHCPGAFRDLAALLARLHQMDPATLMNTPAAPQGDHMAALLEQYQKKWRDNARQPSPLVDYAYAWAATECRRDAGRSAFVHGDAGPYNMLVENDRLAALLDWEFAHLGDPAEDLGIARCYAEDFMPWSEFMAAYQSAGGQSVPESRIHLGMLLQFLKGTTLVAASGRNFIEGGTTEFIKGANAFTGQRLIELRIAGLLKRFGAV